MKRIVALFVIGVVAVFAMVSCGGGGGGGSAAPAPAGAELAGQYTMTGIRYEFSNGLVATEKDLVPWSGNMDIGHTTLSIKFTLLGESTSTGGAYSATWSSATSGTISDGSDSMPFTLSNGNFTLIFPDMDIDVGLTADVFFYWHKVSDSHVSLSPEIESVGTDNLGIFESISQSMRSLMK